MRAALSVTSGDLIRALQAAMPDIDEAVRARAMEVAQQHAGEGVTTRVLRRGDGIYAVEITNISRPAERAP